MTSDNTSCTSTSPVSSNTKWTFGWKRKIGETVSKQKSKAFENDAKEEGDIEVESGEIDWISLMPKRKVISIEDAVVKSNRLKKEGATLAENERFWEAIKKWDEALTFTPDDETLHEMKSQSYLALCEVFPAVHSAEHAIRLKPTWWVGQQSLGRGYLGLGEVQMAITCFTKAIHLDPSQIELWEEDLKWACSLWEKKLQAEKELSNVKEQSDKAKIKEIEEHKEESEGLQIEKYQKPDTEHLLDTADTTEANDHRTIESPPENYVKMKF
ncbi:unnamed protein product [Owenia fusiformis]|uniref:Uncharacterized protein n=1 Tax=Owenia fusiformis TaxID=6347 RepID=A0A8J1TRL0_OWEFU|nr:unnamed protein product [Owenia fusiformis]